MYIRQTFEIKNQVQLPYSRKLTRHKINDHEINTKEINANGQNLF